MLLITIAQVPQQMSVIRGSPFQSLLSRKINWMWLALRILYAVESDAMENINSNM